MTKLTPPKNVNGQYTHEAILIFKKQLALILQSQLYGGNGEGMKGLLSSMTNELYKVKSTRVCTCASILKASKKSADTASTSSRTVAPEITTHSDAQEEANPQNIFIQAVIRAKEGITEGLHQHRCQGYCQRHPTNI